MKPKINKTPHVCAFDEFVTKHKLQDKTLVELSTLPTVREFCQRYGNTRFIPEALLSMVSVVPTEEQEEVKAA